MSRYPVHSLRNLALIGAAASGKTSLLDALLLRAGAISRAGSIEHGDTVSDFDPQEKALGHSIYPALVHLDWQGRHVNLIDTPGLADLAGRALSCLAAVETAVLCVSAAAGVESATRRLMAEAGTACRMIVVTRMDAAGADLPALLAEIGSAFGRNCLPLNLPSHDGRRVVDCFFAPQYDTPTAFSSVRAAHDALVDQVVELDDELMALYLEQGEALTPEQLHAPFEAALRAQHLIPVCFTAAHSAAGVSELLDVFACLAPDPSEGNPPQFVKGDGADSQAVSVRPDPDAHVVAHVFQIGNDPYRGKLGMFRIHQGTVRAGSQLLLGETRKALRVAHLLQLQGRSQLEIDEAGPGEIVALARVDELHRDAVLHDSHDEDRYHLPPLPLPQAVASVALKPEKLGDEQKLSAALHSLCEEDPCLAVEFDVRSKRTVLRALGELHLKLLLEQLARRWNLKLETSPPSVAYRETVQQPAQARYRHKKQSGGAGQFGEVELRIEPLARGAGFEFVDAVKGGTIPGSYMAAVEKGVRQALQEGVLAGFPLHDVRVTVLDGKHHAVDSNEVSFITAARHALREAMVAAHPLLLEPVGKVTVRVADADFGGVSGELSNRRGHLLGSEAPRAGVSDILAQVPLAELGGLEARLRALLAGDCNYTVEFSHYERVPEAVQARLAQAYRQG